MPKLKSPKTLEKIALEALGKRVSQKAREAIDSGIEINTTCLHDYLYAELPHVPWHKVTTHMLSEILGSIYDEKLMGSLVDEVYTNENVNNVVKSIILAIICHNISFLDLSKLPSYAHYILSCHIQTFKKLQTLSIYLLSDVKTFHIGLRSLKFLVNFSMHDSCTDTIIQTLVSCCSTTIESIYVEYSEKVSDASFKYFMDCQKLKHLYISETSITPEGFVKFLQNIQQCQKSDNTAKGFLRLSAGSWFVCKISTRELNEIAISCPLLKQLKISTLHGDLESLVSLTTLEVLNLFGCDPHQCNLDGFLRVRGCNLISLKLTCVWSIDLTCIMNQCINIKKITVTAGSIRDIRLKNAEIAAEACRNLEILKLCCEFSTSSIERILYACVNVTVLCLFPNLNHITDEIILRLLSNNPLKKLKSFIVDSTMLTTNSVNAIIEHCPLLEELMINCLSELETKDLRQKIAEKNQDLRIIVEDYE